MRKRNIKVIADYLFWGLIYILPLLVYFAIVIFIKPDYGGDVSYFLDFFKGLMQSFVDTDGFIFQCFNDLLGNLYLGENHYEPLFGAWSPVVFYLSYCATVTLAHVFFDIMVFIPRLAHKWLGKATQQDD